MAITKDIKTAKSSQEIDNLGFDTQFNLPVVEALIYNPITGAMDRMTQPSGDSTFSTNHLDDYTTTSVTYIGQEDASGVWKMIKIDETGTFPVFTYASIANNPTLTTYSTAWTARTTATYNIYSTAF
jgi:hypothetical protein